MKYYRVIFIRESLPIILAAKSYIIFHMPLMSRDDIVNVYENV